MSEKTIEQMVDEAVGRATSGILADYEIKIQKAFETGAEIGAAKGAEIGAQAALIAIENEQKRYRQMQYDKQYHNTKLLLQHYRALNSHYQNAIWEEDENEAQEESFEEIMWLMNNRKYSDEVVVDSIRKSSKKTRIIMSHINKMLAEYRDECEKSKKAEDRRRWRVIRDLYIAENQLPAPDVAKRENIDKRTVYKDIDAAVSDLTVLFFGVDGIEKM